jgi:sarcosine oxidase
MPALPSILVVGAGVFGTTAAIELQRRGHAVTLIDPGPLPHGNAASTDVSKVVRMDYADEFYLSLMEATFDGWHAWNRQWGEELYHEDGFLLLCSAPMEAATFEGAAFTQLQRRGHRLERLAASALRRWPAVAADSYVDGYFNPRAGWAESGRVMERLIGDARAAGVNVRAGIAMTRTIETDACVTGIVATDGQRLEADIVLIAAGVWTPVLAPQLAPMIRTIGQPVWHFRPADPTPFEPARLPVWAADLGSKGWYGFPALPNGVVKVANHGPGRAFHPDDPRVVLEEEVERCRAFLRSSFPTLADAPLAGTRLCLYCDTWDSNFYIDHDPERRGLVVATGGSGHAFKFAPALGAIIADVVEHQPNPWAARFGWRIPESTQPSTAPRK